MTELTAVDLRPLGPGDTVANGTVVPYYLADRKLRVSIARVSSVAMFERTMFSRRR